MIKKLVRVMFYSFLPVVVAISCSNQSSQNKTDADKPAPKKDSVKKVEPAPSVATKPVNVDTITPNRKYNDVARYIAGLKQEAGSTLPATLEKDTVWIRYSKNFTYEWGQTDKVRLKPMADWAVTELASQRKMNLDVFYPFSGPDILHANVLFPMAKHYHLYGLERAGALPDLAKMKPKEVDSYLAEVYGSLTDILTKSYFITKNMLNDLQKNNVNGTLPLVTIFLVRNGYDIVNVKYYHLNDNGTDSPLSKDSTPTHTNDFVKVYFKHAGDSNIQVVSYMKCNMVDAEIKKNMGLMAYLKTMPVSTTYIKSASYLLHNPTFSVMRDAVLNKSMSIVEDDTGVPYRYLPSKDWKLTFYGSYIMPVSSFPKGYFQTDL
ncbi:MAG TPA: hypothetical protein VK890_05710, partial [Bacteroidia bacterium]|nr:hypothetical protein [Bacteroidia bacterium]